MRQVVTILILVLAVLFASTGFAQTMRDQTIEVLDGIQAPASGLRLVVEGPEEGVLRVGEPLSLRLRSDRDAYLTVIYLDANGMATVLYPAAEPEAGRIFASVEKQFPPEGGDLKLWAAQPTGCETVFALASPQPVSLAVLGLAPGASGAPAVVEAADMPAVAGRLTTAVSAMDPQAVRFASKKHEIREATAGAGGLGSDPCASKEVECVVSSNGYTSEDVVVCLLGTRAYTRPKLDLDIKFDFGSANLTQASRVKLDRVGEALKDPRIGDQDVIFGGHTDEIGSDQSNEVLSRRRAESARDYLVGKYGIPRERIQAIGYGEISGADDEVQESNRKVELKAAQR